MIRRIWHIFVARNKEFYRDKASFMWNLFFPIFIIVGFSFVFSNSDRAQYKIAVIHEFDNKPILESIKGQYIGLKKTRFIEFIDYFDDNLAFDNLAHHRIDMVIFPEKAEYWISKTSPKSYIVEKLLIAAGSDDYKTSFTKNIISTNEVKYIEWFFPGIIGMNIMFSALFGVGFVIVRYRKNGVLKRFAVTPVRPFEFLFAQIISRLFVIISTAAIIFAVLTPVFSLKCYGSYFDLFIVFSLGAFCLISMGLIISARISSEELTNGVMNIITWPMMFLSEVWFSLEGANIWVKYIAKIFPLTYVIDGMRKVMNDGATLADIKMNLIILSLMSIFFLVVGSTFFIWEKE